MKIDDIYCIFLSFPLYSYKFSNCKETADSFEWLIREAPATSTAACQTVLTNDVVQAEEADAWVSTMVSTILAARMTAVLIKKHLCEKIPVVLRIYNGFVYLDIFFSSFCNIKNTHFQLVCVLIRFEINEDQEWWVCASSLVYMCACYLMCMLFPK